MQAQRTPSETLPLLRIAWPLVMASLLSMGISITDPDAGVLVLKG